MHAAPMNKDVKGKNTDFSTTSDVDVADVPTGRFRELNLGITSGPADPSVRGILP